MKDCKQCGAPISEDRVRRHANYCCDQCQEDAKRARRVASEWRLNGLHCKTCGKPLRADQRWACSRKCASAIRNNNPKYAEDLRQELKRLCALEGDQYLTYTQIGAILGVGKNVVLGMRRRMGLPQRHNPHYKIKPKPVEKPQPQLRLQFSTQQAAALASRPPAPAPRPVLQFAQVKILPARECQFIEADDKPFHFCGAPTWKRSYCKHHYERCYFPSPRQEYAA